MSVRWWFMLGLGGSVAFGGCGEVATDAPTLAVGTDEVGAEFVSTVDGEGISLAEVTAAAELGGLEPREALGQLQEELLLIREARRRGFAGDPVVQRRVLAQATLEAIEEERSPEAVDAAEARRIYDANTEQTQQPARRATRHVLVPVPEGATDADDAQAASRARALLAAAEAAGSPGAFFGSIDPREGALGLQLVVESLPALPRRGAVEEPYAEAMFRLGEPGLVPGVVRTSYGWHVIWVTEATEASTTSFEEAEAEIRGLISQRDRNQALEGTFEDARRDVLRNDEAIAAALEAIVFEGER